MLDKLTSAQISEWQAYDKIDPIGKWRDDFNTASIESLLINVVNKLYAKKGSTPKVTTAVDFMPNWSGEKEEPKVQSLEEMKKTLLSIAQAQNKKVSITQKKKLPSKPVKKENK